MMKKWIGALLVALSPVLWAAQASTVLQTTGSPSGLAIVNQANSALAAIASQQSGSADPGAIGAYTWWADTGAGQLRQRNAANSAWVAIAPLGQPVLPLSGGTLTGPLVAAGRLQADGAAGTQRVIDVTSSNVLRWRWLLYSDAETGGTAGWGGSTLYLQRFNNNASGGSNALQVDRATGQMTLEVAPQFPAPPASDSSSKAPTTAWVRTYASSGTYTPSFANNSYVFTSAATGLWTRTGNIVHVAVRLNCTTTTNTTGASFEMSLPVPSNITNVAEVVGTGYALTSFVVNPIAVQGVVANPGRVYVLWAPTAAAGGYVNIKFSYEVH